MNARVPDIRAQRSISRRLALATGVVTLALALAMTAVQMHAAYVADIARLQERLDEIGANTVPSLAASVWQVDPARINLLLDGIERGDGFAYLRLRDDTGAVVERGRRPARAAAQRSWPLVHHEGRRYDMGALEVVMDDRAIVAGLLARTASRTLTLVTALTVGALLVWLLFRHWVTRHLARMAEYVRTLNVEAIDTPLVLDKRDDAAPDELDEVAASINRMRRAIAAQLTVRRVHEAELEKHRDHLEAMVTARTEALEAQRDAVQRLANTDHLTGVLSRRHFYDCAERELVRAHRDGTPLAMLMVDIDHFKRINDTHGHAAGDQVLKAFAQACAPHLPEGAIFGRLGGEEFALVLPGCGRDGVLQLAESLRSTIAAVHVPAPDGQVLSFTASLGAALLTQPDPDVDAVLKRCDDALYSAKRAGRDRVVLNAQEQATAPNLQA